MLWVDGAFLWVGREAGRVVYRVVRQTGDGGLAIEGPAAVSRDVLWTRHVLGIGYRPPTIGDPVIARLSAAFPGLRPYSAGSLFEGLVTSIVGQSITVASAAIATTRLAALFHPGLEIHGHILRPLPTPAELAAADPATLRTSGVTWRRAGALVSAGRAALGPDWPTDELARADPATARSRLRELPSVGPWTAASALLWGIGAVDVHPRNDAALLRAARVAFDRPDLDHRALDAMAENWVPGGGWAARLLWHALLGPAPAALPA